MRPVRRFNSVALVVSATPPKVTDDVLTLPSKLATSVPVVIDKFSVVAP